MKAFWGMLALIMALGSNAQAEGATQVVHAGITVTAQALAQRLADYVAEESAIKGGALYILDEQLGKVVALKADKLDDGGHIHHLGGADFLTWGVFKDAEGHVYMLDFYLALTDGKLRFSAPATIYSRDKVKRYTWDESGPVMKRAPLPAKQP